MKHLLLIAVLLCACGDSTPGTDGSTSNMNGRPKTAALSYQGGAAQTSFAGTVDPTAVAGPAPSAMVPCSSSCTSQQAETNRAALKSTIDYAAVHNMRVYIPPGQYPVGCASGQSYGVDLSGDSNVTIDGTGATLRFTGNQNSTACAMVWLHNASHVVINGLAFSQRDVTNATVDTVALKIGDGGNGTVDDLRLTDLQFTEGVGGDFVRIDGGTSAVSVQRVTIAHSRFEGCARNAIDVRPGVQQLTVSYNFFRSNLGRDFIDEDTGDGPIGQQTIDHNLMERGTSGTPQAITISGHGAINDQDRSAVVYNRIIPLLGATTGGGTIDGVNLNKTNVAYNTVIFNNSGSSVAAIDLGGRLRDVAVSYNYVERGTSAADGSVISVRDTTSRAPQNIQVRANRIHQYAGVSPGVRVDGTARFNVSENNISYHGATADSGATGFIGIACSGVTAACSGTIEQNRVKQGDQLLRASLNLATKTTNVNTVIEARLPETSGNALTVAFVGDAGANAGSFTEVGNVITIHFKPAGTTVANFETLLLSTTLIHTKTAGTAANVLQNADAFTATSLAGAAQAGRMLAGVQVLVGSGTTVGRLALRDNFVDGARDQMYLDATGSTAYPEGYPLISGNTAVNTSAEFEGAIATWRTETTSDAETIASGATSISKHMSFLTTANTVAYTQADGVQDGFRHCYKVKTTSGSPSGTWTPTHFADGTLHTITWTAVGGSWCVVWDNAATTWRLVSLLAPATLN